MLLQNFDPDALLASAAGPVIGLAIAFLHQVLVHVHDLYDLAARVALGQHQAVQDVMQVELLRVSEFLLLLAAELTRWPPGFVRGRLQNNLLFVLLFLFRHRWLDNSRLWVSMHS